MVILFFPEKKNRSARWPKGTSSRSSMPPRQPSHSLAHLGQDHFEVDLLKKPESKVLQGRLVDGLSIQPLAGGLVSLHDDADSAMAADSAGLFTLEVARSLPAVVLIQVEGYPLTHLTLEEIPEGRVDIVLFKEVKLSALVTDDVTAAPIQGARVTVEEPDGGGASSLADPGGVAGPLAVKPFLKLIRGADGSFRGVLGVLRVLAEAAGYRPLNTQLEPESDMTKVLLRLRPVSALRGRVLDGRGFPVPGALVMAEWSINIGHDTSEFGWSRTLSDEQGLFELDVPSGRDGSLTLGAAREGYGPAVLRLDLQSRGAGEALVLTLEPRNDLQGTVTDRRGNPLEGIRISLKGEPLKRIPGLLRTILGDVYGSPIGMAESDETGNFMVPGLLPGSYELKVLHSSYVLSEPLTLNIRYPGELQIILDTGEVVSGVVVNPDKGIPVDAATIRVNAHHGEPEEERSFNVNPDGEFHITGLRRDQLYYLTAMAKGYLDQNVSVVAPGTTDIVVTMEAISANVPGMSGKLKIHFTSSGFNVHDLKSFFVVGIFDQAGNRQGTYRRRSAANGIVAVDNLPEGVFDLAISSDRYAPVLLEDVPIDPEGAPLAVELKPGCLVVGEESPPGSLPPGTLIELRDSGYNVPIFIIHRREGGWRLSVLEEGKPYTLTITDRGSILGTQEFIARCKEAVPLRLASSAR